MAQARGINAQVLLDYEAAFKTDPASPLGIRIPVNTFEVNSKRALNETNTITGTRNPVEPIRGNIDISGSAAVPVDQVAIGYWLKGLFGAPTTTGASAPYTHKFKVSSTQPSLVLEKGFTDIAQYIKLNGCKVNSFKMSFGGDAELVANIDLLGAKETISDTSYKATPTDITLARFANFQATLEEGGATIATVTQGEFTINANLDGNQYCVGGQGTRNDLPEGIMQVSGSITALFDGNTLLNKAVNGTKSSLKVKFTNGANSLEFFFPEIVYEHATPGISGPAGVMLTLPWRAFYATDAAKSACQATLVNGQVAY